MKLIKQIPMRCNNVILSHNSKFMVNLKSMKVIIYDLEKDCLFDTLNIKYCGNAVFSDNDIMLILKTTEGKVVGYDLIKRLIVFSKKFGKDDGYKITFANEKQIITGDWSNNNNILLDLSTLEMKKFSIQGLGMCKFLTKYKDGFLVCHNPIDENAEEITFLGYTGKQPYLERTDILFLDKNFNYIETLFEVDDALACIFDFSNGKLFSTYMNILRVFDIHRREEKCFYFDELEAITALSVSRSKKYAFIGDGVFSGFLLNDKLEKIYEFENSNHMTGLSAIFSDDESKIIVNSNGKVSIYALEKESGNTIRRINPPDFLCSLFT